MERKFHFIYRIVRVDGMYYIGMHSTNNLDDGYLGSGLRISRSIKTHGSHLHTKEILEYLPTREALKLREKELITEEMRSDIFCMNIAPGGDGGWCGNSNSLIPLLDPEVRRRGAESAAKTVRQRRESSVEYNDAFLEYCKKGRKSSSCFAGKTHSEETKEKMRKPKNVGEANSQFGTCWVTNGTPIKIKKSQLEEYLANGYSRGRKK